MKNLLSLLVAVLVSASPLSAQKAEGVAGAWYGEMLVSGRVELVPFELQLSREGDALQGDFRFAGNELPVEGSFDLETGALALRAEEQDVTITMVLTLADGKLAGRLERSRGDGLDLVATRSRPTLPTERLVVDFSIERPRAVALAELEAALANDVEAMIATFVEDRNVVGLSAAIVVDGELVDVRSIGWEDHHDGVPATEKTMYRWASISKPLTAVAALQLAQDGRLDLDQDIRELVPEYDKGAVITSRQLLCHQGGVTHYQDMLIRDAKEYEHPHPWSDRIIAMDLFINTELLFEPGTRYSYTTPGYVVLGAVIERAGEARYDDQVRERICAPLGMESMQPDYPWVEIPHRSNGYHREGDELVDSGDNNVSWKLPAGGWISTVGDLARFGVGLMGWELLDLETQLEMWTPQATSKGEATGYGLGVGVGEFRGVKAISHSGGQLKTSTYLLVSPEYGLAVALMCNTSGTGLGGLAEEIMGRAMDHQDG